MIWVFRGDKSVSQQLSNGQLEKCIGLLSPTEIASGCFREGDLSVLSQFGECIGDFALFESRS